MLMTPMTQSTSLARTPVYRYLPKAPTDLTVDHRLQLRRATRSDGGYQEETPHHLSLDCRYFERFTKIRDARRTYVREVGEDCKLEEAVWSNPAAAKLVLHAVRCHTSCI